MRDAQPLRIAALVLLGAGLLGLAGLAPATARAATPLSAGVLESYVARIARAWVSDTSPDGEVLDPLNPADSGDDYGVIMLADVMLKTAARSGDTTLAQTGMRIVEQAATLPDVSGPFNLLAISALLRDGQRGRFLPSVWSQIGGITTALADRTGPQAGPNCLTTPGCYSNWRLVWAAGASALLASGQQPAAVWPAEIPVDLALAVTHAGPPARPSPLTGARELSDPGSEPPAYDLFSSALLELAAEADPAAMTPAVEALREQAARYALELMAPDGQLSYAGRSLDQSWVQAAGVDLGAHQAALDPDRAGQWQDFAERAFSYLMHDYPPRPDGILPIVPGLLSDWSPTIMDSYAALDQYEGLTLWFLADALEHWPQAGVAHAPLPVDATDYLMGDLHSSGLAWGRSGRVWWAVSGHTIGHDPRAAQGLVALKLEAGGAWRDLLALRPRAGGPSTIWTLTLPGGRVATPTFTAIHGDGHHAVLSGAYRLTTGHVIGPARWVLTTTPRGLRMTMPIGHQGTVRAGIWVTGSGVRVSAPEAQTTDGTCTATASGRACPVTLTWKHAPAKLEIG
ncbi:MAG TPA: hypothetical protein VGL57_14070 [Solirubrobacteraceae bacterium]|jgi:hypothetical protein